MSNCYRTLLLCCDVQTETRLNHRMVCKSTSCPPIFSLSKTSIKLTQRLGESETEYERIFEVKHCANMYRLHDSILERVKKKNGKKNFDFVLKMDCFGCQSV